MALSNLAITFDAQPPVYFPGKPISGRVTFSVTEPLAFDQVRVECFGIVSTKRTKTSTSSGGFPKNVIYSAYEVCCDQDKTVLDGTRGSGTPESVPAKDHAVTNGTEVSTPEHEKPVTLARKVSALKPASKSAIQPGAYSFPFTFFLPIKCPSSFEGSYGHIRYFCKALVTSGGAVQYSGKEAFTVIGWLDLNASPTASLYYQTEANTNTDEKGGKLLVRLYLRQQGYVPGEMVNARMELVNNSTKPVSVIFAQFVQRVTYAAKRENADDWSKWEERKVLQQATRKEKVAASKSSLLKWDVFNVPPCCPTMVVDTQILRVQYEIQFHFTFDSNAPALVVSAPVMVGAIPLKQSFDELRTVHMRQMDANIHSGSYLALIERYPEMPLPVYKPQTADPVDIREPSDMVFMPNAKHFAPMAAVYDAKPTETMDDTRRASRRDSTEPKRGSIRSRSSFTLSRLSFRGSTNNLAATSPEEEQESPQLGVPKLEDPKLKKKQEKEEKKLEKEKEKQEKEKEKEEKKRLQEEKKRQQQAEKEAKEAAKPKAGRSFSMWGKKKSTDMTASTPNLAMVETSPTGTAPIVAAPLVITHAGIVSVAPSPVGPSPVGSLAAGTPSPEPRFQHKGTQEPPVENGASAGGDTSASEEYF